MRSISDSSNLESGGGWGPRPFAKANLEVIPEDEEVLAGGGKDSVSDLTITFPTGARESFGESSRAASPEVMSLIPGAASILTAGEAGASFGISRSEDEMNFPERLRGAGFPGTIGTRIAAEGRLNSCALGIALG
jgi:hypothetical protein